MSDGPLEPDAARPIRLTPREARGELPAVCVRTGDGAAVISPVRLARAPWWSAAPLALLLMAAAATGSSRLLASWWMAGALLLPLFTSRGMVARLPLSEEVRTQLRNLRRRRFRLMMGALLLTWVAVSLFLFVSRPAGVVVLAAVIAMYLLAVGTYVASRMVGVGGRPEDDGGATLRNAHPRFIAAVERGREDSGA